MTSTPPLEIIDEFRCDCISGERLHNFISLAVRCSSPSSPGPQTGLQSLFLCL